MDSILNVEILKQTLWIYLFVFAGAGVITFVFRKTNWGRNITVATAMWFVIFVLFIFGAFFGWLPFSFIILVIAFGAVREFYILNGVYNKTSMFTASVLLLAMAAAVGMGKFHLFYYIPGLSVFVFFPLHMFRNSWNSIIGSVSKQVLGLIYWGWLPLHFLLLHRLDCGYGAIVVICSMIALNDNCAYYVGKLLGKNSKKLAPNISPNKTRTGFVGGTVATICIALSFSYALPDLSLLQRLLLGLIAACSIPVGDLLESAMKRDLDVKDSSSLIPGHGGMMDRFDSWTFTTPAAYYFLLYITTGNVVPV